MTIALRDRRRASLVTLLAVVLAACTATSAPTPTPTSVPTGTPTPTSVPTGTPTPTSVPTGTPSPTFPDIPPLPSDLVIPPAADFAVSSTTNRGLELGRAIGFSLGHCGLFSPVDLDGSLWEPVGGVDQQGGPIDTNDEVGELINATEGEVMLVWPARLDFRTLSGLVVVFRRLDGPRMYPGCQ